MTVRTKLAAILLSLIILPMLLGIAVLSGYIHDIVRDVRTLQLENIANLERNKLDAYFAERKGDVELFRTSSGVKENIAILSSLSGNKQNPAYLKAQKTLVERLAAMRQIYGYLDVMVTDTAGNILCIGNESHISNELGKNIGVMDAKAFEGGRTGVYFSGIYKTGEKSFVMLLTAPLYGRPGKFIGEAVFEIDAGHLFGLLQDSTGLGETGETYIGALSGGEAHFVNPFHPERNRTIAASNFFGPKRAMPMQQALKGRPGSGEAVDYLGHEVIAAWRPINTTRWGLVTKIDSSEAFAPVTAMKKLAFTLELVIMLFCVIAAFLLSSSVTGPIKDLQKGAEIIGLGNLDYKVGTARKDEIGQLSRAFDLMAENLKKITASRDELDAEVSERKRVEEEQRRTEETLRASLRLSEYALDHSLDELITKTLDETELLTGSRIGFFHFLEPDQKTLVLQTWSTNTLKSMCTAEGKGAHYPIDKAGVWVEAVIMRRPVIHNDYAYMGGKKGLPQGHAPVIRELVAPIIRSGMIMGIIGVGNKPEEYLDEDIEVVTQLADRAWDIILAKRADEALALQVRHASLGADIGVALTRGDNIQSVLQGCAEAMVRRLDAAFARIWTVSPDGKMLEMQASAGMYTHTDGPSAHIPMAADRKIAVIARDRLPHLTNSVIGDSLIIDQQWARREGMVSFAGYPLTIEDRVVGVMALFSRDPLPDATLDALASVADGISIGIERLRVNEEIKRLNEELEQRVVKRTAELTSTNKELEAFSYSVSHDLRAPLRHIHGFVELLVKNAGGSLDEKSRRYLNTISSSASQMGELIDDLLVFSRMGRAEMHRSMVDIKKLVETVIGEMRYDTKGRNITWNIGKLPPAEGDPSMLRLVMMNLISNALKFTGKKDHAEIEVGAYPGEDGEKVYFVRDNGVGFDMQYVGKLFGVFQRLHRPEEFEGTGIGLANVRRIVSRHGGRTWAEGEPDKGTTVYFSLPGT